MLSVVGYCLLGQERAPDTRFVCGREETPLSDDDMLSRFALVTFPFLRPERQEKWALHCLYKSTEGQAWACNEGWETLFEANISALYGVSTEAGRVTKISLGANNLEGAFSAI